MRKLPEITATNIIASSSLFRIEQVHLTFSNGEQRIFERIRSKNPHFGAVMIAPITHDNHIILAREYAVGTEQYELSLPKGIIEQDETPEAAANREMQEEIGMAAEEFHHLGTLSAAPNYFAANMDVVLAHNLHPAILPGDEPEPIEAVYWPIDDITTLITDGHITEARAIAALYLTTEWLAKNAT